MLGTEESRQLPEMGDRNDQKKKKRKSKKPKKKDIGFTYISLLHPEVGFMRTHGKEQSCRSSFPVNPWLNVQKDMFS